MPRISLRPHPRICFGPRSTWDWQIISGSEAHTSSPGLEERCGIGTNHHHVSSIPDIVGVGVVSDRTNRCYTNHALDQFLNHLLAVGVRSIIRIGGQSRSPDLEGHNLRTVSENTARTKHEGYLLGSTYSERKEELDRAGKRLGTLHKLRKGLPWTAITRFLQWQHLRIHSQLSKDETDGFRKVDKMDPFERWLRAGNGDHAVSSSQENANPPSVDVLTARANENIDSLALSERHFLANHWAAMLQREQTENLFANIKQSEELYEYVNSVHSEINRRTLLTADVIGVTTTTLARDISTLQKLRAKVVVCEEAAEVLEAHTISALMPGVEHFIQIGDHQQLRPQINNYSLSLENPRGSLYRLDRSQFERLAVGEPGLPTMPVAQLNVQRRMRPQISSLLRRQCIATWKITPPSRLCLMLLACEKMSFG